MSWLAIAAVYLVMVVPAGIFAGRCMAIGNVDHEDERG